MVNGYHLHKTAGWQCLSDGGNRWVLKEGPGLARVQHNERDAVCKPSEGKIRGRRLPCNL